MTNWSKTASMAPRSLCPCKSIMSPAQNSGLDVERAMFHEMAHRLDAVPVAPLGDSAVHGAAPRFGEGRKVLVPGGGLVVAGQLELVGDEGLLPIDLPLVEHAAKLGAPIAAGLGLVVEESADRASELGAEMIVMRLVDGGEEPIDAVLARAVHAELASLAQRWSQHVGEIHDLPPAGRNLPGELALRR